MGNYLSEKEFFFKLPLRKIPEAAFFFLAGTAIQLSHLVLKLPKSLILCYNVTCGDFDHPPITHNIILVCYTDYIMFLGFREWKVAGTLDALIRYKCAENGR